MINNYILESAKVVNSLRNQATKIKKISSLIFNCSKKNKVLVAGNGGSSADADHFVGELICTYSKRNRKPISAISLTQPVSAMTAWSNDFDYNSFIQRQVEANGKKGDILFLLSTGGGSLKDKTSGNAVICRPCEKVSATSWVLKPNKVMPSANSLCIVFSYCYF